MNLFASNHLAKVEPVASELEKAADNIGGCRIGGHPMQDMSRLLAGNRARIFAPMRRRVCCLPPLITTVLRLRTFTPPAAGSRSARPTLSRRSGPWRGFSAPLRAAVISAMESKGIVSNDVNQISAAASRKTTINSIMASTPSAQPALKLLMAQCRRLGFELQPDKQVSLAEFDEAVKGKDVSDRWAAKLSMKRFGLI